MLFSVILGEQNGIDNNWEVIEDNYGNTIIANNSIRQKIRLGKKVDKKFEKVYSDGEANSYNIAENTFISNNYSNMNLSLMNFWHEDKEIQEQHNDDQICFITFTNNKYKMISYDNFSNEIVQTYRKINEYQGCAFTFNYLGCKLFRIYAKNLVINKFVDILISVDENGKIVIDETVVEDKEQLNSLRSQFKSLNKRINHFRITAESGKLLTKAYITDTAHKDFTLELLTDVPNADVIILETSKPGELSDSDKEVVDFVLEKNKNLRAITVVGTELPRDFCKEYKLLYLFKYDTTINQVVCLKSN